jgi:hypothetical protein
VIRQKELTTNGVTKAPIKHLLWWLVWRARAAIRWLFKSINLINYFVLNLNGFPSFECVESIRCFKQGECQRVRIQCYKCRMPAPPLILPANTPSQSTPESKIFRYGTASRLRCVFSGSFCEGLGSHAPISDSSEDVYRKCVCLPAVRLGLGMIALTMPPPLPIPV